MTLTRQEIFDKAWIGLKAQGFRQSLDGDNAACLYRGMEGRRCAIGFIVPDEAYSSELEAYTPHDRYLQRVCGIAEDDGHFCAQLQYAHDCADTPKSMENRLRAFAGQYSLTIPE